MRLLLAQYLCTRHPIVHLASVQANTPKLNFETITHIWPVSQMLTSVLHMKRLNWLQPLVFLRQLLRWILNQSRKCLEVPVMSQIAHQMNYDVMLKVSNIEVRFKQSHKYLNPSIVIKNSIISMDLEVQLCARNRLASN